jgi:hypothetical protein
VRTHELVVSARDATAVRIVEGPENRIEGMVWTVRSPETAADWLRKHDLLRAERHGTISIARETLQGVNIRLQAEE